MTETHPQPDGLPLSALDLQVLLVLSREDLYGYAIMKEVELRSDGLLSPEIGSLYRVLGRLMDQGWAAEAPPPPGAMEGGRGKPRKYYRITDAGLSVARAELRRMEEVLRQVRRLGPEVAG
ncbi:MAG: PadR family transcriptional regulator [Gemmatimonadota bacterium]